jgi:hypothetical protein
MSAEIYGDRPLDEDGVDQLGFTPLAVRIATALVDRGTADGIVVGIEGEWGSGKSSLTNLVIRNLNALHKTKRPIIIRFNPWIVGNRDALLIALFGELARAIDEIQYSEGNSTGRTVTKAKDAAEKIRGYGSRLGAFAPLVSLAGMAVPGAAAVAALLENIAAASSIEVKGPTLSETRDELNRSLSGLPKRIIVVIDDVDRLEPMELVEILRLVRSVADFKNIVYTLCYDPKIVGAAIKSAIGISDGESFLEKIVQVSIAVPSPEPFILRRMFSDGLEGFIGKIDDRIGTRLSDVIDQEGGRRLHTPRNVIRLLDSIKFVWPSLHNRVDIPDLIWLYMIRNSNNDLFKWIEKYIGSMSAISSGYARVDSAHRENDFQQLVDILSKDNMKFEDVRWKFAEVLPGIAFGALSSDKCPIYSNEPDASRLGVIAGRRLASPDHYRLFFALEVPEGVPSDKDFQEQWNAIDKSSTEFGKLLLKWHRVRPYGIGSKAEIMIERLRVAVPEMLNSERSQNIMIALSEVLDKTFKKGETKTWGGPAIWHEAKRLLPILRSRIVDGRALMLKVFQSGGAIGWLSKVFRDEIFDHGRYGQSSKPQNSWVFSDEELDDITTVMHKRFESMTMDEILDTPYPLSILFAWSQSGGAENARKLVESATQTDDDLVRVLNHMANVIRTSSGSVGADEPATRSLIITRDGLEQFLDYDAVKQKIFLLSEGDSALATEAKVLKAQFELGSNY